MGIVLIVAVLVIAVAMLYITVTLSTRTRQSTAPLIDDAFKGVSGQIDAAAQDLRRQIADGRQQDMEQLRTDGRRIQGHLDQLDSQASGMTSQVLAELDTIGVLYVCEVPKNFVCFPSLPKYHSLQRPFTPKRVDNAVVWGKPFVGRKWHKISLARQTLPPQVWQIKAAQVYLARDGRPTDRTYWLIVARNVQTKEIKYFISNAPPKTAVTTLMKVAFTRAGVEHVFRLAKTEIGFSHFEGRSYKGLLRHMILCQLTLLFVAEQTDRLRGEKSGVDRVDDGADGAGVEYLVPALAPVPLQAICL